MPDDCLCHVRGDFEIVYCLLHAAAPELFSALVSCDSVLSYIYHRERSRLTAGTQQQIQETMMEVQRITRTKGASGNV